jgi:ATP-dependent exoDNAse (exonuclease V) beta subunit
MKKFLLEKLEEFNDSDFIFDPIKHRYTYLGEEFTSVTRFIQQFHKPFEQQYWSQRKAEEAGVPQEWILNEWKKLNDYANEVGTETHNWIEDYFNKNWRELPTNLDVINRINKFNIIYAKQLHKLEPLKFEVRIFSKKWKIAGMVDALFLYRGRIYIIDYKTNKNFTTDENTRYPEKLLVPFSEFNKNHLNEYSIQISLYALILKEWGFDVAGGYLVYIGPGEEPAKMYKCVNMVDILYNYLNGGQLN